MSAFKFFGTIGGVELRDTSGAKEDGSDGQGKVCREGREGDPAQDPPAADKLEERVPVRYVSAPSLPLWLDGPARETVGSLSLARARSGTVFNLTSDQWNSLFHVAGG